MKIVDYIYMYEILKNWLYFFLGMSSERPTLPGWPLFPFSTLSLPKGIGTQSSSSFYGVCARWTPARRAAEAELPFPSQDEKNQVLTTYIWYRQVSDQPCALPHVLGSGPPLPGGIPPSQRNQESQRPGREKGKGEAQRQTHETQESGLLLSQNW